MSLSKFSKDVLIVTAEYNDYNDLDTYNKNIANKVIDHLVSRLTKFGFQNFYLTGDDSLSIEVNDKLKEYGNSTVVCNMYPESAKRFLANNVLNKSRNQFLFDSHKLELPNNKLVELDKLDSTIGMMLGNTVKLNETVPNSDKIEVIKRVLMLRYLGFPINETSIYQHDDDFTFFYASIDKTESEFEAMIRDDLDYRWEWAQNLLKYSYEEDTSGSTSIDLMELLGEMTEDTKESNISFAINKDEIVYAEPKKEDKPSINTEIDLVDGLSTISKQEALQSESLVMEMNKIIHQIDEYTNIIYSQLINNTNLIIDLHISLTSARSRKLPYKNYEDNKMLLSIDLKSGEVDIYFKGSPFKLNPFFEKGETVKTNVLEW